MIVPTHLDFVRFYFSSILPAFRLCSKNNIKEIGTILSKVIIISYFMWYYHGKHFQIRRVVYYPQLMIMGLHFFARDWRIIYIMNKENTSPLQLINISRIHYKLAISYALLISGYLFFGHVYHLFDLISFSMQN